MNNIKFYFFIFLTFVGFVQAQPVLVTDSGQLTFFTNSNNFSNINSKSSATTTLNLPFLDDFSGIDQYPDSILWDYNYCGFNLPVNNTPIAVNPPGKGVMMFDGTNKEGQQYSIPLPAPAPLPVGYADLLVSNYIDLSNHSPSDSLYLSFYLQPQGLGNAPETSDSFIVSFMDSLGYFHELAGFPGTSFEPFDLKMIPVTDSMCFHSEFRLMFKNIATLSGSMDHWLLDYVYLDASRSHSDTLFNDAAFVSIDYPYLKPYTALPFRQWIATDPDSVFNTYNSELVNLKSTNISVQFSSSISDSLAQFASTTQNMPVTIVPGVGQTFSLSQFTTSVSQTSYGNFTHTTWMSGSTDFIPGNDTFRSVFYADSLLAYDDGSADAGYGISTIFTQQRGFAEWFDLKTQDTLIGVRISFVPTLYNFDDTKNFRLVLYYGDADEPDSIRYQQFCIINYGTKLNDFIGYSFDSSYVVTSGFWMGITQFDGTPIGVGIDRTPLQFPVLKWDSSGYWVNSSYQGALLMRPVFKTLPVVTGIEESTSNSLFSVFPNPVSGRKISISRNEVSLKEDITFELISTIGKSEFKCILNTSKDYFELPETIAPGIYFLKGSTSGYTGIFKLIIL